jgi:hypothetical protein
VAVLRSPIDSALATQLLPPTLANAVRIPFYREHWRGIDVAAVAAAGALEELPCVDRAAAARYSQTFECSNVPLRVTHTSGTTGAPLIRVRSEEEVRFVAEFMARPSVPDDAGEHPLSLLVETHDHGVGVPIPTENVVLRADGRDPAAPAEVTAMLARRYDIAGMTPHVAALGCVLPFLRALTAHLAHVGIDPKTFGLTAITTTGDHLPARTARELEAAWGCPVANRYSVSEVLGGATRCRHCGRLTFDPTVVAEVVDRDTRRPVAEGVGLLCLTELYPFTRLQPLIRYLPGDLVEVLREGCGARPGPTFRFLGRDRDALFGPHGLAVFATELADALEAIPGLERDTELLGRRAQPHERDIPPVLGEVRLEGSTVVLTVAARGEPVTARELHELVPAAVLAGCPRLRSLVEMRKARLRVRLVPAGELHGRVLAPN